MGVAPIMLIVLGRYGFWSGHPGIDSGKQTSRWAGLSIVALDQTQIAQQETQGKGRFPGAISDSVRCIIKRGEVQEGDVPTEIQERIQMVAISETASTSHPVLHISFGTILLGVACLFSSAALRAEEEAHADLKDPVTPLVIGPAGGGVIEDLKLKDWRGYNTFRATIVNSGTEPEDLTFEIIDTPGTTNYWNRHIEMATLKPGENVLDLDYSGGLYRGEPTSHWRGPIKTPVEMDKLARVTFYHQGKAKLSVTKLELVKVKQLTTPGAFAFDFGGPLSSVMTQFIGVKPDSLYVAEKKYGFVGGSGKTLNKEMTWPTPMLGDGVVFPAGGFQADLEGGDYLGFFALERGGYWGPEEGCMYDHMALKANGVVVHEHDFTRTGLHFFFEDTEVTDLNQIADKIIFPAAAAHQFKFKAAKGANVFNVDIKNPASWVGLRVAGLILAPDTAEGRAYLDAHLALQRKMIAQTFAPVEHGKREGRKPPEKPLVYEVLPPGAEVLPKDYPAGNVNNPPAEVFAVCGQTVCIHLGLYAQKDGTVSVNAASAKNGAVSLADAKVSYGRYLPTRGQVGSAWMSIHHYRPENTFIAGAELSRSLIVEYKVPLDAAAGVYTSTIEISGAGTKLTVPVSIRVVAAKLPELPIPVGLFVSSYVPESLDEPAWWKLTESVLREEMSAGLNILSAGAGYNYENGKISGDRALKYIQLAQKIGPVKAIVNYGGFHNTPSAADAPAYVAAIKQWEEINHLPPHYFNCYDEPATVEAVNSVLPTTAAITKAGGRTCGWTSEHSDAGGDAYGNAWKQLIEKSYAPACNLHDTGWFKKVKNMGNHPWVYNQGSSRPYTGLYLWRQIKLGAEGRIDWIGFNTQGFAFNDLDGREPAYANFHVHSKFGVLSTPAWLSRREGLLDCRIRLALEAVAKPDDPALKVWTMEGYRDEIQKWDDARLSEARHVMLKRLQELTSK
jgi:hypothetical protein